MLHKGKGRDGLRGGGKGEEEKEERGGVQGCTPSFHVNIGQGLSPD